MFQHAHFQHLWMKQDYPVLSGCLRALGPECVYDRFYLLSNRIILSAEQQAYNYWQQFRGTSQQILLRNLYGSYDFQIISVTAMAAHGIRRVSFTTHTGRSLKFRSLKCQAWHEVSKTSNIMASTLFKQCCPPSRVTKMCLTLNKIGSLSLLTFRQPLKSYVPSPHIKTQSHCRWTR